MSNTWNTDKLTNLQVLQMEQLLQLNPQADSLFVESVVRMPPDKLAEIVRKHKAGELATEVIAEREYELKGSVTVE